jgi:signal transduction histidine kinase
VIREVLGALADRALHAELTLVAAGGDGVEVPLRPRMLRVVVENLVGNAIRYAGPGATCTVTATDDGTGPLLVVADDGKGVSRADLPRLYERFSRADPARTSRGTGLGLAIVKHIVTSAGGTVEARGAQLQGLEIVCRF